MALVTNFNANPYYDDFDEDKKFLRLLFKPGSAVQARELTQIQSLLQNQVKRQGDFVFKNGSLVTGGQIFNQDATYLNLSPIYVESNINANNFVGQTILSLDESKRATVLKVYDIDEGTGDPITLMVQQNYGEPFESNETIKTNELSPYFANVLPAGVGTGQVVSVSEGIYYYDGYFIQTDPQTIAVNKYTNQNQNVRVGYEVTESIVTASSDTSLLDPAQDASNFQAPGADRFVIDLVLSTRDIESADDERFIQLQEIKESVVTENFVQTQLSVLGDILAQRTYDESGNYTVNPFTVALETNEANTAQTSVIISPGKAYVYGTEFKRNSPTIINVDKPRESIEVQNKRINIDYGYFLYTNNHLGNFPVNSLGTVDLHCVSNATINTSSSATIANTRIGSARVKAIEFDSAVNTANASSYEYKTYLFDLRIDDNVTGNVVSAINLVNGSNVVIGNATVGLAFSDDPLSYRGAKVSIQTGPGSTEEPKIIVSWNPTTKTLTLGEAWSTLPTTASQFVISFEVGNIKSLANFNGTSRVCAADVDERSKDPSSFFNYTYIADSSFEPLIFRLGEEFIKQNTISDMSYTYRRLYEGQIFSSGVSPALPVGTGEVLTTSTTINQILNDYLVICTASGTSSYTPGEIIPATAISVNASTRQISVAGAQNMTANILATIDVTLPTYKEKVFVPANTTIQTSGGIDVFGNGAVTLFATQGQVHVDVAFVNKNPNGVNSLFASDVIEITQVLDFRGNAISEANKSSAIDATAKYFFDNGQRNSVYDHASIRLRPRFTPPTGSIVVFFNRFRSSGPGFFTVDSYTANTVTNYDYGLIPIFNSPNLTGETSVYQLRDVLDFRPVRADATAGSGSAVVFDVNPATTGPKIPKIGEDVIVDYSYYLPRIDKVILDKSQEFQVVKGVSQLDPPVPKDTDTGMTIYVLRNPPYVANTSDIDMQYINNRRYTMRDIGGIEQRVKNLEYYTSLSLLEQNALSKQDLTMRDSENLLRFKNGIIVDSFTGTSVVDVLHPDYTERPLYSIDPVARELRPSFNVAAYTLEFDSANSSGFDKFGPIVSSASSDQIMINQPKSSKFINLNPFNVINYLGKINLDPPTDFWVDTETRPEVIVNIGGDLDAWQLLANNAALTEWESWSRVSGREIWSDTNLTTSVVDQRFAGRVGWQRSTTTTATTTTLNEVTQNRTGVQTTATVEQITRSIGDRVVDLSVIQYMRSVNVLFTGNDFRPSSTLFSFFDGKPVDQYVNFLNKLFVTTNNLELFTTTGDQEFLDIRDSGGTVRATAVAVQTSNNIVYVANMTPTSDMQFIAAGNATVTGRRSNKTYTLSGFDHHSGTAQSGTNNTIVLRQDATGSLNASNYNGAAIFITSGRGFGQERTISSYNPATRTATVTPNWSVAPDSTSVYSVGRLRTDEFGSIAGVFTLPAGEFRTGEKLFRLIDNSFGDISSSRTNGDATFFAQGLLQTKEETKIETIVPMGVQRQSVSEDRTILEASQSSRSSTVTQWIDPLAETFLVSPQQFPQGVFLSKMRFCFKSKDSRVPVTLQVRPVVNGYPSSSDVYPFGTVTLTPDKVKVTDSPDLDDPAKFTEFVFPSPLFLQPGEHSFVLLANTNEYETFAAEIGRFDLVTGRQISDQPYGGSLFLSQNGSTWTADQSSDLLFRIYRKRFQTNPAQLQFQVKYPSQQTNYDLIRVSTSEVVTQNTSLSYQFNSQTLTENYTGYRFVIPGQDYSMNDGFGTRSFFPSTGNGTFQLASFLSTVNPDISPFLDTTNIGLIGVNNLINNLELSTEDITVVNGGSGYANSNDVIVTISGGNGVGASAVANVVGGVIDAITIVDPGAGYTGTPTITITPGSGGGSGAVAVVTGETSKSGGPAQCKYITRKVTLADGFDSGDLRVYLTAYKPINTNIFVYAKYLSSSDGELFDDKEWQLLTQIGNANFVSTNQNDFRELTFAPGASEVATNKITYTNSQGSTFNTFKTFAVKIVMSSDQTFDVPKIRDFRAIAMPARVV
jgi:hypothetical protein